MTQTYLFAFRLLPQLLFSDARLTRERLLQPGFLAHLWRHAGLHLQSPPSAPPQLETFGDVVLITMPKPNAPPEAYFLALVADEPHLYTLELGTDFETEGPCTYFCGCTPQGHSNYGSGCVPEAGAFLATLAGFR